MSKPIKLPDDVYARLKKASETNKRTLGGQIDYMLDVTGVSGEVGKISLPQKIPEKITSGASPQVDDLFNSGKPVRVTHVTDMEGELECCQHPTRPCKHWVWDNQSGEGYKNTLSGRFREAE